MLKLVTIPAGRLAQWKGSSKWTVDTEKGNLTSSDQTADRPKYSNDSNRFPVLMLAYGPKDDTSFSTIDHSALLELTYALAACSNPKPIMKNEKKSTGTAQLSKQNPLGSLSPTLGTKRQAPPPQPPTPEE